MKLSKRIAIGVMAAVMALSALPVCGGLAAKAAAEQLDAENGKNRTEMYFERLGVDPDGPYYYEFATLTGASAGMITKETTDGVRIGGSSKLGDINWADLSVYDKKTKTNYVVYTNYQVSYNSDVRVNKVDVFENKGYYGIDWPLVKSGTPSTQTTFTLDGVTYYADAYQNGQLESDTYYYCFDMNDTEGKDLKFIVMTEQYEDGPFNYIYKFNEISNQPKMEMLRVPEGYDIYMDYQDTGMVTEKDNYPKK